jgi:glutamate 5-kinase
MQRTRYINAQNTFNELFDMGVIPIVNENDTLAVAEIKFGDNDTLSAFTAVMVHADLLFLMTDVDCLYDKNPRTHADAQAIEVVEDINTLQADISSAGSSIGTGGMYTKIVAAKLATSAGVTTVITKASKPGNIAEIVRHIQGQRSPASPLHTPSSSTTNATDLSGLTGQTLASQVRAKMPLHTRFLPSAERIRDRYFWILHGLKPHGTLYIDAGAHRALVGKAGLLPVGVVHVEGSFAQQEAVRLVVVDKRATVAPGEEGKSFESSGHEVGRAIVNYASAEIVRIKGHQSTEIESLLGYADSDYVAPRENISLTRTESRPATPMPTTPLRSRDSMDFGISVYENMG